MRVSLKDAILIDKCQMYINLVGTTTTYRKNKNAPLVTLFYFEIISHIVDQSMILLTNCHSTFCVNVTSDRVRVSELYHLEELISNEENYMCQNEPKYTCPTFYGFSSI